jgi:F-type H+-transporting ATPase subunit b
MLTTVIMSGKFLRLMPLLAFGTATPAFAAEGGLLQPNTGLTFWTIIVFVLVLAILWKTALPPILQAVEAREQQMRDMIAAAAADREAAQLALQQHNTQLEETRTKVQEMVAEGRVAGERVREEIISEARRQAEEIVVRARRDVRQELDQALEDLRVAAVDIAIVAASKLIDRNLDEEDNRRLVRDYLADLEADRTATATAGV